MPEAKPKKSYPIVLRPEERKLLVKCLGIAKYQGHNPEPLSTVEYSQVGELLKRLGVREEIAEKPDGSYFNIIDELAG